MKRLHVVSNTHWDREHRHGLQETRCMLVEMTDRLVEMMESDPNYRFFTMDGQVVPIEDYLEVKPEMRKRLTNLIRSKRILIGPWYTLPDMNAVSPESLVRNLLMGDRVCKEYGPKMNFGFSIFSFGQIAQLPQLYRGFGIEDVIVYKRYSPKIFKQSEYIWTAPDGSSVLASRLGSLFRVNFFMCFSAPVILGGDPLQPNWAVKFSDRTRLAHMIDEHFAANHSAELEQDVRVREEKIAKAIQDVMDSLSDTAAKNTFLAFDGCDFTYPLQEVVQAIQKANEIAGDDLEIIQSTPIEYFKELREELDLESLMNYTGEIRFGPIDALHCESQSANIEIKLANHRAENTILHYAEPFALFDSLGSGDYPQQLLDRAWKYLFKSHAHDSIHGTGVPKIKRDTLFRLEQSQELGESVARRAFEGLVRQMDTSDCEEDEMLITVFNPSPRRREEVLALQIDLPMRDYVTEYHLETLDGERLESFEYSSRKVHMAAVNGENRPKAVHCDRRWVDVYVPELPACGYETLKIVHNKNEFEQISPFTRPVFPLDPIGKEPNILDNGVLRVEVASDGSVSVTDLKNGHTYNGMNVFIDSGCAGDLWIHCPPDRDRLISSTGFPAKIGTTRNSALCGEIRIDQTMELPVSLTQDRKARCEQSVPVTVTTVISLKKNQRRVDFKVLVKNTVMDHKLLVSFPTGIETDHVHTENPFEVRKRPVTYAAGEEGKIDTEVILRQPMQTFLDVSDGKRGVSLFTKGLKEYETKFAADNTVNVELTLLRAVTQTFPIHNDVFVEFPDDQASQCIGEHTFEYALYFHPGDHIKGNVIAQSNRYQAPPTAIQFGKGTGRGDLPLQQEFVKVSDPNTIVCCIKKACDSDTAVIRLNNPTAKAIRETIECSREIKEVWLADMNENKTTQLQAASNAFKVDLPAYGIVTLLIELE